jgi:hypothetical protein
MATFAVAGDDGNVFMLITSDTNGPKLIAVGDLSQRLVEIDIDNIPKELMSPVTSRDEREIARYLKEYRVEGGKLIKAPSP